LSGVSRAINGRPGVRPDVRQRVREVAELMGFRPNRAATNLASGRSSVIGFVIPSDELRVDPYGASMTHAAGRAATERDLGLMLHLAQTEPGQTVHHILRDGMIDGLLISSVAVGKPWVDFFEPLVFLISAREKLPISVGLYQFLGIYDTNIPLVQAGAFIAMAFPLLVFIALQRIFLRGINLSGSLK
jgi:DNA-binding LacI/PurR family transcriptional regulator